MILLIGFDSRDGTREVVLLDGTITDDDHIVENLGIFLQCNVHYGLCGYSHRLETHERDGDLAALRSRNSKITVEVRNGASFLSDYADSSTHDGFAGIILYVTFDLNLGKGSKRDEKPTNEGKDSQRNPDVYLLHHTCLSLVNYIY